MPKPSPYKGQRGVALLQSAAQTAAAAGEVAADATTPEWNNVQNKPEDFPPESHTHSEDDIDGLVSDLTTLDSTKADDADVVHNTGDEDIAGEKTFEADILFDTDDIGIVLIDRTTATRYRLYVDVGVLLIEVVV